MTSGADAHVHRYVRDRTDAGELSTATARKVTSTLVQWSSFAGPTEGWSRELVDEWLDSDSIAAPTRRRRAGRLRMFMAWLVEHSELDENLAAHWTRSGRTYDLPEAYIADRLARGEIVERTARNFRSYLNVWHDYAGPIDTWTPDMAIAWVHSSAIRPGTRRNRLNRLRPYVRWLVKHGHLPVDITDEIASVPLPAPNPRDLQIDEVALVVAAACDERTRLILLLMVQCGLRSVDISRVRIEDLDTRRRTLAVRSKGGQGEVTHHVPVPDEAWEAVSAWARRSRRFAGPLIANERLVTPAPLTPGRVSKLAKKAVEAAGLKDFAFDGVSPHALRHSCAQHMIDDGADIREVQHALGHRHVTTTEIYLRRQPPGLREAMNGRRYGSVGQVDDRDTP